MVGQTEICSAALTAENLVVWLAVQSVVALAAEMAESWDFRKAGHWVAVKAEH